MPELTSNTRKADWLESLIEVRGLGKPQKRIFSPDIFEREAEQIFFRQWLFVDHASRIPAPGDDFTYEIAGESLIFARGENHERFSTSADIAVPESA